MKKQKNKIEKHSDCACYTPVDAAKGICVRLKRIVALDTSVCVKAVCKPKCRYCVNFVRQEEAEGFLSNRGLCTGWEKQSWVYGDLGAENCERFKMI